MSALMNATDPHELFALWYAEAEAAEPRVPDAMQVATVDSDGIPDVRTVLLKQFGPDGWVFFTNLSSAKAHQLASNPNVSCLLHWKSLERQVRVHAVARPADPEVSDAYFASRPRGSQLGAWASRQSDRLPGRDALTSRLVEASERFEGGKVPRPEFWGGYHLTVSRFEFWQGRDDRLHHRVVFAPEGDGWDRWMLYP